MRGAGLGGANQPIERPHDRHHQNWGLVEFDLKETVLPE